MEFRFSTTLNCHLVTGETQTIRSFPITVDADTAFQARSYIRAVATETIHEEGSDILLAPMNDLVVVSANLLSA